MEKDDTLTNLNLVIKKKTLPPPTEIHSVQPTETGYLGDSRRTQPFYLLTDLYYTNDEPAKQHIPILKIGNNCKKQNLSTARTGEGLENHRNNRTPKKTYKTYAKRLDYE